MRIISIIAVLLFTSTLYTPTAEARRGCCSHHGGVCGCRCCDGTSLSAKCAPYYPACRSKKKTVKRVQKKARKAQKSKQKAYVVKVSDGDTIKAKILPDGPVATVRVLGIDCPESHKNQKCSRDGRQGRKNCDWQIPRGLKASKKASEMMKAKSVYLECDGACKNGSYGRRLRYIRLEDGRDFGLEMVKLGLCKDFGWKYPHPRMRVYKKAQGVAKRLGQGIWE